MGYPWNSSYLLTEFLRLVGRPQVSDAVTRASYFQRLSDAYVQIIAEIAAVCPNVITLPVAPLVMLTTNNKTFTFGIDDNGFEVTPIGRAKIYRSLDDVPDSPMEPGVDYVPLGGTGIRIEQGYTGTLYWRGVVNPGPLADTGLREPALYPEAARQLIAYRAAINFLTEGGRNLDLADRYIAMYGRPLTSEPGMFAQWVTVWKTQFSGGGAVNTWTGRDLALAGQYSNG